MKDVALIIKLGTKERLQSHHNTMLHLSSCGWEDYCSATAFPALGLNQKREDAPWLAAATAPPFIPPTSLGKYITVLEVSRDMVRWCCQARAKGKTSLGCVHRAPFHDTDSPLFPLRLKSKWGELLGKECIYSLLRKLKANHTDLIAHAVICPLLLTSSICQDCAWMNYSSRSVHSKSTSKIFCKP